MLKLKSFPVEAKDIRNKLYAILEQPDVKMGEYLDLNRILDIMINFDAYAVRSDFDHVLEDGSSSTEIPSSRAFTVVPSTYDKIIERMKR